ncbi:MAG: glycosyltransferase [Robiginitalea sp.]|uniref:glycosyltransferase n=1 Tax=Robiginitalea sp. TaxID=1902411 RepID=UPI003C72AC33
MSGPDTDPKSLLVIGHQWPEPEATAAGVRMLWLLKGFLQKDFQVVFACAAGPGDYRVDLGKLGIKEVGSQMNDSSFDRFLQKHEFSHVLFDRFLTEEQFGWRVRDNLPGAQILLDTEDLHSLRHSREDAIRKGGEWSVSGWVEHPLFYREIASMFRSDLNLIISKHEMELLQAQIPHLQEKLVYLPFGMDAPVNVPGISFQNRSNFVFLGNGKHLPNLDAIAQLKSEIWPLIRKRLPEAALQIYGAYLPNQILQMDAPAEGFQVKGWAPELQPVLNNTRLLLAPLRFGAGIKGKILKAAAFGLPVMGTSVGFEGIMEKHETLSFVADSAQHFAEKAVELYTDPVGWERALKLQEQAAGVHLYTSFETLSRAMDSYPERREALPQETRLIQNLLQNEAFGRLRYLSRWIEAKEKGKN